ncbi:TPA: fimbrial protein [Providencia rettgeri]
MKYKLLILTFSLLSVSTYSSANNWRIYCGDNSPSVSYEDARQDGLSSGAIFPTKWGFKITGLPTVITPKQGEAGVNGYVNVKCALTQSTRIRSFKTDRNWQDFNVGGTWSPRISLPISHYLLPFTGDKDNSDIGGQYSGSIPGPDDNNKWYKIANSQTRMNTIRFKPNAGVIPNGTILFHMELRGRADLPGDDQAFNVHVPVITSSEIRVLEPTCDFSVPSASLTLDSYRPDVTVSKDIPISIKCNTNNKVNITFMGETIDSNRTIFKNTVTNNPAKGIGFKIIDTDNRTMRANVPVTYNIEADTNMRLFKAEYAPEPSSTVKAGNVQSVVNMQMQYN